MSASDLASGQNEARTQNGDTSTRNNTYNSQGISSASRSMNSNGYGGQYQSGYSSFDPESGSNYMGSGYSGGYGNSYGNSSYGGMGSGYGSYGSAYNSYGGGYGSSYGSYGSYGSGYGGNSSYGGANQYSNRMSKPLPNSNGENAQENMPPQQPPVSQDVWGFLNGMHAILNILYAGTGIVQFGKMFAKMSMKIIKMVCGKSLGVIFKLTGFRFLKNIIQSMAAGKDWTAEFSSADLNLESEWGNTKPEKMNRSLFGKIILITRLCSFLGAMFAWFLRNKSQERLNAGQNQPHLSIQNEVTQAVNAEVTEAQMEVQFEGVRSLYNEVKNIEDDIQKEADIMVQAFEDQSEDMDSDLRKLDEFAKEAGIELAKEEAKIEESPQETIQLIQPETEIIQASHEEPVIVHNEESVVEQKLQEIVANDAMKAVEEAIEVINTEEAPGIIDIGQAVLLSNEDKKVEEIVVKPVEIPVKPVNNEVKIVDESAPIVNTSQITPNIWKSPDLAAAEETKATEEKKETVTKQKTFELPSVLQSLRDKPSTASKPWLLKKSKTANTTTAETESKTPVAAAVGEVKAVNESIPEVTIGENCTSTPGNTENKAAEELMNGAAAVNGTQVAL